MAGSTPASLSAEAPLAPGAVAAKDKARRFSPTLEAWRRFRRHKLAVMSAVILLLMIAAISIGPLLWQVPINEIDFTAKLEGPSWNHPFGTDDLGQDVLSRLLYGGRISLAVGLSAMLVASIVGMLVGSLAGMSRGSIDAALMWLTDLFLSLPQLPLLLLVIYLFRDGLKAVLGPEGGVFVMIVVVIGGLRWMPVARLVRAQILSIREKEFVEAARGGGGGGGGGGGEALRPSALGPVIVAGTIDVAAAIIAESTLSFLGLGFPPDIPTWGRVLFDAKDYLDIAPHWALFPGAAIFLAVLSINFIGDGLRDALDPRRVL
jgi:peptide/nickel transport system permease protein